MSFNIVNKYGIDIGSDRWAFTGNGDPTSGAGCKAGIGSVYVQLDSSPANLFWDKTGPQQTDWVALSASGAAGVSAAASSSGAYRASSYSVPVDGVTDAGAALTTLVGTTIPQTGGPYSVVVGPGEIIKLANDFTMPANVRLQGFGGLIQPASGKKVTLMSQPESAGKLFDHSAGGTVVAGVPMTVKPEWWGAWATGTGVTAVDSPAVVNAFKAIVPTGGTLRLSQMYNATTAIDLTGLDHSGITIDGGESGGFYNTIDKADVGGSMVHIAGTAAYSATNLTLKNLTIRGNGTSDLQKGLYIGNVDGLTFENCKMYDIAKEGFYLPGATSTKNVTWRNCYAKNIGVGGVLSAYNANAHSVTIEHCKATGCGQTVEQSGIGFRMIGCYSENPTFVHAALASTWSSSWDGATEIDFDGGLVANNYFTGAKPAITMSDISGHVTGGHQTNGGTGKFLITSNIALGTSGFFSGGCDLLNEIVIQNNYCEDAPNGNASAIDGSKGRFVIKGNTFKKGATSAWASIVRLGDRDPVNTSGVIEGNTIIGAAWTGSAFTVGPEITLAHNIFESPPAASTNTRRYRFAGNALEGDGGFAISDWIPGTDTWVPVQDADFVYAPSQTSRIRVLNAPPTKGTWQRGDRAENIGTTNTIPGWLCTTGGTSDTITVTSVTITTTLNSLNFTVTAGTSRVMRYQWVTIAGVAGAKQLATYNPSTGVGTFDTVANATVTSGAAAFSAPVWTAANNAASLTIASQAIGDMLWANSTTTFARLAAGTQGMYLSQGATGPQWGNAPARAANVNIGAGATATWAATAPRQLFTATTASATLTVSSIPSGEYLTLDVAQDGTGGRVVTIAQTGMGSLVWANGNVAPTLTTTASKLDTYEFFNDGARVVATVISQNT